MVGKRKTAIGICKCSERGAWALQARNKQQQQQNMSKDEFVLAYGLEVTVCHYVL